MPPVIGARRAEALPRAAAVVSRAAVEEPPEAVEVAVEEPPAVGVAEAAVAAVVAAVAVAVVANPASPFGLRRASCQQVAGP